MLLHPGQNDSGQSNNTETTFHFEVGEVYGRFFMITIRSSEDIEMLLVISGDSFSVVL